MTDSHPLEDSRVRALVGFSGGLVIALFAVLFLEGVIMYFVLGVAVLDVVLTPHLLRRAVERQNRGASD